jgi:hypothetical protein
VKWFKRQCTSSRMTFLSVGIFESVIFGSNSVQSQKDIHEGRSWCHRSGWSCKVSLSLPLLISGTG